MKTAAAYIRVSSKRQAEEGASIDEQKSSILEYCERNNIKVVKWYIDAGVSGRKINRPAFNELLVDVKTGIYDMVIVWKLDRLSRRPIMGYRLKEAMDTTRTEFYSIIEGNTVNNRVMFGIWLAWAEQESLDKSVRAKVGAKGRVKKGKIFHDAKYGYQMGEDGTPEINEPEAEVVRRVFKEYLEGVPTLHISDRLNRDGILPRRRAYWHPPAILLIIKATHYKGIAHFGQVKRIAAEGDHITTEKTESSEWTEVAYPVIVDESDWEAAQQLRKAKGRGYGPKGDPLESPLRGLMYCRCGSKYTVTNTRANGVTRKTDTRNYVCIVGRYNKNAGCARRHVGAKGIEAAVWGYVKAVVKEPEIIRRGLEVARAEYAQTGTLDEIEENRRMLESVGQERQRALTAYQKGYLGDDELDVRMRSIGERREMYQFEVYRLESQVSEYETHMARIDAFIPMAQDMASTIDDWTPQERAELIKALVKKVTVTDNTGDPTHDIDVRGHLDEYITNAMQFCLREAWE